ncbi:MAG: PKD domain-containing protein, partial [Candidatus Lokiarchaeota archaeon]|nr:PKD domain-containing protein [Candidatus Lokiarchaeota archaeon]
QFTFNGTEGNSPALYSWDFGNGTPILTTTSHTITHLYAIAGIYTVILNVTDANGDWDIEIKTFYIKVLDDFVEILPEADFYANATTISEGDVVRFTFNGTEGNGQLSFFWDFGDSITSTEQNPMHQYTTAGNYTVTLIITDSYGYNSTKTKVDYIIVSIKEEENSVIGFDLIIFSGLTCFISMITIYLKRIRNNRSQK